jgi:hypothetical protein
MKEKCKEAAQRLAYAIAYFIASDLDQLKALLDRTLKDFDSVSEALRESEKEIERFSYWRVTVTLTNNGKDPIAVSPWATMLVQPPPAKDARNTNPLAPESQQAKTPPISIPVQVVEPRTVRVSAGRGVEKEIEIEHPSQAPTVIEGGKAVSITMRSSERISSSDAGEIALRAFQGEHANVMLSLLPLTALSGASNTRRAAVSQAIEFRDLGSAGP